MREKEVEVIHREGETTPLDHTAIAANFHGQNGSVLLCRYRED